MGRFLWMLLVIILFLGCEEKKTVPTLAEGPWLGMLQVSKNETLPFNFQVKRNDTLHTIEIYNADEVVEVDEVSITGDSIRIQMPVFEGYIEGVFSGTSIEADFIKESLDRVVPFSAKAGNFPRFEIETESKVSLSGIWETTFDLGSEAPYPAKGIFIQNGNTITGTFRTQVGDFRYLEGVVEGDSLKLSTFDGAHAFLFVAKATDSTLEGTFYSGNHSVEQFSAKRNANFELPDANTLTYLKEGYDKLEFSFPDAEGKQVSLEDEAFQDKVVLVQIMGTWCPNCLDETRFYVEYLKKNPSEDLQFVALAFEYAKTEEKAFAGIKRLKERVSVPYPILLAQVGTSDKQRANEKLPMLNHVLSYPTTIYVDKKGAVRKIHTGFNGPATKDKHEAFKKEFDQTVKMLLAE